MMQAETFERHSKCYCKTENVESCNEAELSVVSGTS